MSLRWLPNAICVLRMLLAGPVAFALARGEYLLTVGLFAVAALSDGLDGWLAKTFGWTSRLGKILDPIADKLLLVTVFITLVWIGRVPLWLAAAVVVRDLVIVGGAIAYQCFIGRLEGHPTYVSKLNTVVQLLFVLIVIASAAWPAVPVTVVTAAGAACFVTTVVSGLDYVLTYGRMAWRESRGSAAAVR
ncbi:MAG TPA: CDP-alcohol phosphatidyltransferase family protein [Steroidobacteraceae bacterium]|nr:CDP-alcohol phosphatidyltransferase family protein [Steroidobacteraceae bacterium]